MYKDICFLHFKIYIYNGKEYFGHNPVKVHSNINKTNFSSLRLYKKFGFRFRSISEKYVESCRNVETLEHEKI